MAMIALTTSVLYPLDETAAINWSAIMLKNVPGMLHPKHISNLKES
jgi:hypothetical protein